jgi:two-component system, OmpR family, alkaline phosphatase synthesis response regulator PhoP
MTEKKKILVVDDEPDHCALVQRILEKAGFEVDVAYDGNECLQTVKGIQPDAIIMDVVMPDIDGLNVGKTLKADQQLCRIPILILTAETTALTATRFSHDRSKYANADDYLLKPASPEEITRSIAALLNR